MKVFETSSSLGNIFLNNSLNAHVGTEKKNLFGLARVSVHAHTLLFCFT